MQKTKLKELIISWFGSKTSYNLHKSENPDGLNLVALGGEPEMIYDEGEGYIRYVSGRMVCTAYEESPYGVQRTWTFPQPFKEKPIITLGSQGGGESTVRLDEVTGTYCVHRRHYTGSGKGSGTVNIVAMGRWR